MSSRICVRWVISLILVWFLTSCGDKNSPPTQTASPPPTTASPSATTQPAADATQDPIINVIAQALAQSEKSGSDPGSTIKGNCVQMDGVRSDGTPFTYCFYTWKNARCTTVPTDCLNITGKCTPTNPLPVVPPC
jgi:hypothetical protein